MANPLLFAQVEVDENGNMKIDLDAGATDPKNVLPAEVYQSAENYDIVTKLEREFYIDDFFNSCGANINYSIDDIKKDLQVDALNVGPNELVICLGEGDAKLLNYLLSEGYNAYGMDVWYDLRNYSTYGVKETSLSRLHDMLSAIHSNQGRIFNGKANSLPLKDESVDKLLSNKMLNNVDPADRRTVIMEVLRVLKVGGIAKISGYMPNIQNNKGIIEDFLSFLQDEGKIKYEIVEKTIYSSKDNSKQMESYTISIEKLASIKPSEMVMKTQVKEPSMVQTEDKFSSYKPLEFGTSMSGSEVISELSGRTGSSSLDLEEQLDLLMQIWSEKNGILSDTDSLLLFGTEEKKGIYDHIYKLTLNGKLSEVETLQFFLVLSGALAWQNQKIGVSDFGRLSRSSTNLIIDSYDSYGLLSTSNPVLNIEKNIQAKPYIRNNIRFMELFRFGMSNIKVYEASTRGRL